MNKPGTIIDKIIAFVFSGSARLALVGSCFLLALLPAPIAAAAAAEKDEWLIEQVHENKMLVTVHCTRDALSVKMMPQACYIIAKAPDWKIHCFRPQEKKEWIGDMQQFSGIVMFNPYAVASPIRNVHPAILVGQREVAGMRCKSYRSFNTTAQCTDQIVVDQQIVRFFNRLYGTPMMPSLPLQSITNRDGKGLNPSNKANWLNCDAGMDLRQGFIRVLSTKSCRKIPFDANDFVFPKGYKRVVDLIQVSYSKEERSEIDEMINNVGFESKDEDKQTK